MKQDMFKAQTAPATTLPGLILSAEDGGLIKARRNTPHRHRAPLAQHHRSQSRGANRASVRSHC